MSTNPLLARFVGAAVAALVAPEMQSQFEVCLTQAHAAMDTADFREAVRMDTGEFWAFDPDSYMARLRPYVVKDGILQIPVKGVLLHDFPYALGGWATGYDYIWRAFQRGMGDLNVKGIALICDTPGGEVAGNFDLVDRMYALAHAEGAKPVRGFAHEYAYSAGYSIISVCTGGIAISRTGGVGSIGVVTSHLDASEAMAKSGLKITFIFAGKHKVDGNPYEALSADVKARIQARIDTLYEVFVSTVARNRPALSEEAIRATEALTFTAAEAVENKLADTIGSLDDAVAAFAADLSQQGEETMADQADTQAVDQAAAQEAAVAAARQEGHTAGLAAGATAERARITGILGSDAGKERPQAALAAALETDMSLEQATAFLGKLPKEAAEAAPVTEPTGTAGGGTDAFEAAMGNSEQPNLGAGGAPGGENATADGSADVALAKKFGLAGFDHGEA